MGLVHLRDKKEKRKKEVRKGNALSPAVFHLPAGTLREIRG